ncbi:hypothetical protein ACFV6F_07035 [Kitasatospora phosalacinea]|uniref:hypothetical protein n=1 Tax=Kitasatospora phosalacinea TaxID=2065 RepID=UPI003653CF51
MHPPDLVSREPDSNTGGTVLSSVVMTHPRRGELAAELARSLGIPGVVLDPDPDGPPSPLRTAVRAWASVPAGATHHAVVQDDISAAPSLLRVLAASATRHPRAALAFYANWDSRNGALVRLAALAGANWVRALDDDYTPVLTVVLPAAAAREFAVFARNETVKHDDETMARYLRHKALDTYLAAPTPVEHEGDLSISEMNHHGVRRSACHLADPRMELLLSEGAVIDVVPRIPYFRYGSAYLILSERGSTRSVPWQEAARTGLLGAAAGGLADGSELKRLSTEGSWRTVTAYLGDHYTESLWVHCYLTGWFARELSAVVGSHRTPVHEALAATVWERAASTIGIASVDGDKRAVLRPDVREALRTASVDRVRQGWEAAGVRADRGA